VSSRAATALSGPAKTKTFPVVEIFGPTVQGEGLEAGLPCHFVRLGGCDYLCSWCDTMYAVDPVQVRENSERLSAEQILDRVGDLAGSPEWVVLSGGNPALHELGPVVKGVQAIDRKVAVETQGSRWRDWLGQVDRLTISPKPPSSGMASAAHRQQLSAFMARATELPPEVPALKIVCFDEIDLRWAKEVAAEWPQLPLSLSAGTPVPAPSDLRGAVAARFRWLAEAVAADPELAGARVLPQLHVIAWGDARGV
jgi:7-carboxy-7-deazaguanine synthase